MPEGVIHQMSFWQNLLAEQGSLFILDNFWGHIMNIRVKDLDYLKVVTENLTQMICARNFHKHTAH